MATTQTSAGLAGVIAGEAAICTVGKEGAGLTYRAYNRYDLAAHATFEEVAYLLICGKLPNQIELERCNKHLKSMRSRQETHRMISL